MDAARAFWPSTAHSPKVWDPVGGAVPAPSGPKFDGHFSLRLAHVDATRKPWLQAAHRQDLQFLPSQSPLPSSASVSRSTFYGHEEALYTKARRVPKYSSSSKKLGHEFRRDGSFVERLVFIHGAAQSEMQSRSLAQAVSSFRWIKFSRSPTAIGLPYR